jgi:hypothetical protein
VHGTEISAAIAPEPPALPSQITGSLTGPIHVFVVVLFMKYRDFIMSNYQELKKANPTFPILIREASGVEARLIARYGEYAT